jgi:hypothetical protein
LTDDKKIFSTIAFLLIACASGAFAQPARVLTAEDYARAERMLVYNTSPLVDRGAVRPNFLPDGRFYYQMMTPSGTEFVLVNPANGSRTVGATLAQLSVTPPAAGQGRRDPNAVVSPDGMKAVFIKDWNLWLRDLATGKEMPLTADGTENFGYATDTPAGAKRSPGRSLVARFEKNRHLPTGPAQRERYVSRFDERRRAEAASLEIPAAGRADHHDSPRRRRDRNAARHSPADAARRAARNFV